MNWDTIAHKDLPRHAPPWPAADELLRRQEGQGREGGPITQATQTLKVDSVLHRTLLKRSACALGREFFSEGCPRVLSASK